MKIRNWKRKISFCILIAWYILLRKCPYAWLLGIECPGCGMTRAHLALLKLDFAKAFSMHPMFWSVPILLVYYFLDGELFKVKWLNNAILILIFAGFFINWFVKLLL